MIEIEITEAVSQQRVDKYVRKLLNLAPLSFIYKLFRKKDIKINKHWVKPDYLLAPGDLLQIYVTDAQLEEFNKPKEFIKSSFSFPIVYEDEHLLVVDKPVGILVHGDYQEKRKTLANEVLNYLYDKGEYHPHQKGFTPAPAHRLDRNTGGLILFGKDLPTLQVLQKLFKEQKEIKKYYYALVKGHPPRQGRITSRLEKDPESGQVRVSKYGLEALTNYEVLEEIGDYALLKVEIVTGRTHQIRVHLQSIGHPIIGDPKYGDFTLNRWFKKEFGLNHQFLYASEIALQKLEEPLKYLSGKTFIMALPEKAQAIINKLKENGGK